MRLVWRGVGIGCWLALGAVGAGEAAPAAPGPLLWSEREGGGAARVYTDGERAVGGVRVATKDGGDADLSLLGRYQSGDKEYRGKVSGRQRAGGQVSAASGHWTLNPAGRRVVVSLLWANGKRETVWLNWPLVRPGAPPPLRCGWARGTVTRRPAGGKAAALATGDGIAVGDTITTGRDSAAIVVLGDRSVAVLQAETTLALPAGPANRGPAVERVQVHGGKIWFAVRKLGSGQKFEVETDEAVAGVRGTEFVVARGAAGTDVVMADGAADLSDPAGLRPAVPLPAGQGWQRAAGGGAWAAPAPVDLGPLLDEWDELLEIADACWPYRRENRIPFWQDQVAPVPLRAGGRFDPLQLASLVWDAGPFPRLVVDPPVAALPQVPAARNVVPLVPARGVVVGGGGLGNGPGVVVGQPDGNPGGNGRRRRRRGGIDPAGVAIGVGLGALIGGGRGGGNRGPGPLGGMGRGSGPRK
jgi:hypothetical protein